MQRNAVELRILGALIEKALTTPDHYPLSTNALVAACNQKSNRHPVVDYDERTVDAALVELRADGLARTSTAGRANKHRHVLDDVLELDRGGLALLGVLLVRGAQTVGELRTRTERMVDFEDLDAVETALSALAHRPEPLVEALGRRPGQSQQRWIHRMGDGSVEADASDNDADSGHQQRGRAGAAPTGRDTALSAEVERLRRDVDRLYALLGEEPDPAPPTPADEVE